MGTDLIKDNIVFDLDITDKDTLFKRASQLLLENGCITDADVFEKDLFLREKELETGLIDEFAIPHAQSKSVLKPTVAFFKTGTIEDYSTLDESKVRYCFILGIPEEENDKHLDILSNISRKLMDEEFRQRIKYSERPGDIYKLLIEEE